MGAIFRFLCLCVCLGVQRGLSRVLIKYSGNVRLQYQLYRKAIAFDKIGGNYALSAKSIKICLLGYFCMQNSNLR